MVIFPMSAIREVFVTVKKYMPSRDCRGGKYPYFTDELQGQIAKEGEMSQ